MPLWHPSCTARVEDSSAAALPLPPQSGKEHLGVFIAQLIGLMDHSLLLAAVAALATLTDTELQAYEAAGGLLYGPLEWLPCLA